MNLYIKKSLLIALCMSSFGLVGMQAPMGKTVKMNEPMPESTSMAKTYQKQALERQKKWSQEYRGTLNRKKLNEQDQAEFDRVFHTLANALEQHDHSTSETRKNDLRAAILKERANLQHFITAFTKSRDVQSSKNLLDQATAFMTSLGINAPAIQPMQPVATTVKGKLPAMSAKAVTAPDLTFRPCQPLAAAPITIQSITEAKIVLPVQRASASTASSTSTPASASVTQEVAPASTPAPASVSKRAIMIFALAAYTLAEDFLRGSK